MSMQGRLWTLAAAASLAVVAGGGVALAQDTQRGIEAWRTGDYDAAVRLWRPLADRGDADAQYNLGHAYKLGRGVPQNLNLAEQWYERAARQGHEDAAANLGLILFQNGRRQQAMPYIQRAADRGDPRAQYVLGTALFNGDLVGTDLPRAYALMTRAAEQGLPPALSQLRQMEQHISEADRARGIELARALPTLAPAAAAAAASGGPPSVTATPSRPARARPSQTASNQRPNPPATTAPPRRTPPVSQPAPSAARPSSPAPAPAAASGRWRVQLGAYSSEANARRAWGSVSGRLPGLQPAFVRAGNLTRLQAGPLADRTAADRACATARSAGLACFVVAP